MSQGPAAADARAADTGPLGVPPIAVLAVALALEFRLALRGTFGRTYGQVSIDCLTDGGTTVVIRQPLEAVEPREPVVAGSRQ
jgi:hypothetical protein